MQKFVNCPETCYQNSFKHLGSIDNPLLLNQDSLIPKTDIKTLS